MQITLDTGEVMTLLASFPDEMFEIFKNAVNVSTTNVHRKVSNNFGTSGDKLRSRSGRLRRSLIMKVTGESISTLTGFVRAGGGSSPIKYAVFQEFGGTVRPTNNKYARVPGGPYINIPLPDNLHPSGVMRQSAGMVFNEGGTLYKSRRGNWIVKSARGKNMFILKKQSVVKGRLGMLKAHSEQIPILIEDIERGIRNFLI